QIVYFSNNAQFKQKFRFKNPEKPAVISVEFTYQTCDDRVCLAPNTLEFEKKITPVNSGADLENEIVAEEINVQNEVALSRPDVATIVQAAPLDPKNLKINSLDFNNPLTDCGTDPVEKSDSYLTYLILGFLGGLIALLTPCVFPMIPLTVSFF